jgi:hypothetical protein
LQDLHVNLEEEGHVLVKRPRAFSVLLLIELGIVGARGDQRAVLEP